MTSSLRSRHVIAAAATTIAIFLAVLTLLAVRMAGGEDPALGPGSQQPASTSVTQTQAQTPAVVEEQPYEPHEGDSYDAQAYGDQSSGTTAQPQQQAQLQSGTS